MFVYGKSDVGRKRSVNQDNFAVMEFDARCGYAVICDGMGGHNGGNIASETAVNVISEQMSELYDDSVRQRNVAAYLSEAIRKANRAVFALSLRAPELKGMGSTVVCAFVMDDSLYVAHVGDSRIYLYDRQGDRLQQITKDHSVVQQMLDSGQISVNEAEKYPYRHVITRALGIDHDVEVEARVLPFDIGRDVVLLCSDGFSNMVPDSEKVLLLRQDNYRLACDRMIAQANRNGGADNITVAVLCGDADNGKR